MRVQHLQVAFLSYIAVLPAMCPRNFFILFDVVFFRKRQPSRLHESPIKRLLAFCSRLYASMPATLRSEIAYLQEEPVRLLNVLDVPCTPG